MTDLKQTICELDDVVKENEDQIVTSSGADGDLLDPITIWSRDPGPDVRRMEETKMLKAREARERGEDPAPNLSDDVLLRKLGYA